MLKFNMIHLHILHTNQSTKTMACFSTSIFDAESAASELRMQPFGIGNVDPWNLTSQDALMLKPHMESGFWVTPKSRHHLGKGKTTTYIATHLMFVEYSVEPQH